MLDRINDVENLVNFSNNDSSGNLTVLKVVSIISYVAVLVLLILPLQSVLESAEVGGLSEGISVALYLVLFVIIIGGIGCLISTVVSVVGLFVTLDKRQPGTKKGQIVFFSIMSLLPIITELAFYFGVKTLLG